MLVLAIGAFAIALIRIDDARNGSGGEGSPQRTVAEEPARPSRPSPAVAPAPEATAEAASKPPPTRKSSGLEDERLIRLDRFSLAVPDGWTQGAAGGGTLFGPPGHSPVSVQVFFEDGATGGLEATARRSAGFAQSRIGGRMNGAVRRTRVGGEPAFELKVSGASGSELVLGVLTGKATYLVLGDISRSASSAQEAAVRRALKTFRPS